MHFHAVAFTGLTWLAATSALAQSTDKPYYFGTETGSSRFDHRTQVGQNFQSKEGGWVSVSQTLMQAYKVVAGYKVNGFMDFEGAYMITTPMKFKFSGATKNNVSYSGIENISFSGTQLAVHLHPGIEAGSSRAFLAVGGHRLSAKDEITIHSGNVGLEPSAPKSGTGTLIGVGYDTALDKETFFRVSLTQYSNWSGMDVNLTMLSMGLAKKF